MAKKETKKMVEGEEAPSTTDGEVAISSLNTLQPFKYKGQNYKKLRGTRAISAKGDSLITLPPDTKVTPL